MMDEMMVTGNTLNCTEQDEYVEVMFARSLQEAQDCIGFLLKHNVPSRIEGGSGMQPECGVAVLVPTGRMVEATELLAAMSNEEEGGEEAEDEESDDELDDDFDDDEDDEFDDDEDDDIDDDDDEEEEEEEAEEF